MGKVVSAGDLITGSQSSERKTCSTTMISALSNFIQAGGWPAVSVNTGI